MNKYLKKTLVISASILMFLSTGEGINNASAKRHYHYHVYKRIQRCHNNKSGYWKKYRRRNKIHYVWVKYHQVRRHKSRRKSYRWQGITYHSEKAYDKAIYNSAVFGNQRGKRNYHRSKKQHKHIRKFHKEFKSKKHIKMAHKRHQSINSRHVNYRANNYSQNRVSRLNRELASTKNETLIDINHDRQANGLVPVQESSQMDKIANMRAEQASNNFTHYDVNNNNTPYELEDAKALGIPFGKGAQTNSDGVTTSYSFTENLDANYGNSGKQIADNANNDMMYHDQDQGNGHRDNILYKPWRYVGIGTAPCKGEYSGDIVIAEDFADWVGTNPNAESSETNASSVNTNSLSNSLPAGTITDGNGHPISQAQLQQEHEQEQQEAAEANAQYEANFKKEYGSY